MSTHSSLRGACNPPPPDSGRLTGFSLFCVVVYLTGVIQFCFPLWTWDNNTQCDLDTTPYLFASSKTSSIIDSMTFVFTNLKQTLERFPEVWGFFEKKKKQTLGEDKKGNGRAVVGCSWFQIMGPGGLFEIAIFPAILHLAIYCSCLQWASPALAFPPLWLRMALINTYLNNSASLHPSYSYTWASWLKHGWNYIGKAFNVTASREATSPEPSALLPSWHFGCTWNMSLNKQ